MTGGWVLSEPCTTSLALYFVCKGWVQLMRRLRAPVLAPAAVYALHCAHNYLLTHRADAVSKSYLGLWLLVLGPVYRTPQDWRKEFASTACGSAHYQTHQCGRARLRSIPRRFLSTLKKQLPAVASLYTIPLIIFPRGTMRKAKQAGAMNFLLLKLRQVLLSTAVLSALPYALTEFPCVYSWLTSQPADRTKRAPVLHTLSVSVISTAVFLAERDSRLETMVAYTYWRVVEAFVGNKERGAHGTTQADTGTDAAMHRRWYGPCLAALIAAFAAAESELLRSPRPLAVGVA